MLQEFFGEIVTQSDVGMEGGSDSEDEGIQSGEEKELEDEKSLKDVKKKQKMKQGGEEEMENDADDDDEEEESGEFVDKWEEHLADIPTLKVGWISYKNEPSHFSTINFKKKTKKNTQLTKGEAKLNLGLSTG